MLDSSLEILDGIIKGIIIGVVASAPMGPVGILIIQRTLNKGRWYGFVTGIGAALSDLVYAVLTAIGLGLIRPFFESRLIGDFTVQWLFQLLGSLLLFAFGLFTYKSRPTTSLPHKKNKKSLQKGTLLSNGLTGFLVTIGNPIIIFLFLALFTRFNFSTPDRVKLGVEFICIVVGALGWWFGLTYLINKVRTKFDQERIWALNRTIGVIVMVVSLLTFFFTATGKMLY